MATEPVTVPRPRKVPDSLQHRRKCSLSWRLGKTMPPSSPTPALTQAGLVSPAPSHTPNLAQSCCLTPDTEAGDDFLATGPGAKGQEGGAIPGCEVAGRRLAQALVGNLHGEEPQPSRLVWDPPKPGGRVRGYSAPWALPNQPPARPGHVPSHLHSPIPCQCRWAVPLAAFPWECTYLQA